MKKTLSILSLVLVVLLSGTLVGCGSQQPAPTTAPTSAPAPTTAPTSAPAPTTAPTSAPAPTTAPTSAPAPTSVPAGPKSGGKVSVITTIPDTMGNLKEVSWTVGQSLTAFPVVETLVGMTPDGPAPTKLATGWDVAPDGSAITFYLRKGVKFHDGTDFNAEAVKWNIDVIRDRLAELKVITSIDVVDSHTVKINLSDYSNTLLYHFGWYDGLMISPASVEGRDAEYIATHMVGTGPFVLESFAQGVNVVFKKFDGYWDEGKPYLDELEYLKVADTNTARSALLSGQVQAWDYVPPNEVTNFKAQGYGINVAPGLIRIAYTDSANPNSPWFKKEVRYAFDHALDKQALADAFGAGTFEAPVAPCSMQAHIGCSAVSEGRAYDPAKAKQLLTQAGYPNGFKTTIYTQSSTNQELVAAIQGYLLAVGIDAAIEVVDRGKMSTLRTQGWENGMLVQGISTSNANYVQALQTDGPSPTKAYSALVSPEYTALLEKASKATTPALEKQLSEELVKLTFDEAVINPFVVESRVCIFEPSIKDFDLDTFSIWFWNPAEMWIDQ